jgi:hypothetical protein
MNCTEKVVPTQNEDTAKKTAALLVYIICSTIKYRFQVTLCTKGYNFRFVRQKNNYNYAA